MDYRGKKCKFVYKVAGYVIFYDDVEDFLQSYDIKCIISLYHITQEDLIKVGCLKDILCKRRER